MTDPSLHGDWVIVFVTGNPVEAEMIKGLLENEDIPVLARSSQMSPFPETIGATGRIELLVSTANEHKARAIIEDSPS